MINGLRIVAVIPARGGSKSIPGKNIRTLGGKPLIAWSIEVAQSVAEIDRVVVSTDDTHIAAVSRKCGAEVYARPPSLATDDSLVIDALRELLQQLQRERESADILVLLEPTCPLRSQDDVRACLRLLTEAAYDSVATFTEAQLHPHRAWRIVAGTPEVFIANAIPWLPRQKLPPAYQLNGAVYAFRSGLLAAETHALLMGKAGAVLMPRERSHDIDNRSDFDLVEATLKFTKL